MGFLINLLHVVMYLILWAIPLANANDHRAGIHWGRRTNPFTLGVINSLDDKGTRSTWQENWNWTLTQWSQSSKFDLVTVQGDTSPEQRYLCDPVVGYVRFCNYDYGGTGWAGVSEWKYYITADDHEDNHLFECVIRLNDNSGFPSAKHIMCHELGHCLGLDHTSEDRNEETGSCMGYSSAPSSIAPGPQDFALLEDIYGHVDTNDTYELLVETVTHGANVEGVISPAEPTHDSRVPCTNIRNEVGCAQAAGGVCVWLAGVCIDADFVPASACSARVEEAECYGGCFWFSGACHDSDSLTNLQSDSVPPDFAPRIGCEAFITQNDCSGLSHCVWKEDACSLPESVPATNEQFYIETDPEIVLGFEEPQLVGSAPPCKVHNGEKACKKAGCKWSEDENKCSDDKDESSEKGKRRNNRRGLVDDQCRADPTLFNLPADAYPIACSDSSITFERIEGGIGTRYNVVLSNDFRPRRPILRGSG